MAKLNLPDIGTLANSAAARQAINDNFSAIEAAIENTLSRNGLQPNQMEADLDMNSNDILNAGIVDAQAIYINGIPIGQSFVYGTTVYKIFDADGVMTDFPLGTAPGSLGNLDVSIDGVTQLNGVDFTFTGTMLNFAVAPPNLSKVLVRFAVALPQGTMDGASTTFIQIGADAVERDTQGKLREVEISVTDFADNINSLVTGVELCDAAWAKAQAALPLTGGTITFPRGRFRFSDTMRIGNRPPSLPSTLNGVKVKGAGWGRSAQTMNASDAATVLVYDGPSDNRPFVYIDGPISGCSIEGLMIDGNGKSCVPIRSMRSFHQTVKQVLVVNWLNNFALEIGANTPNVGYGGAAPISHLYEQLDFQSPGVGASGVDIANGNGNCNQLLFLRCYLDRYNDPNTIGVRLGYCDHIQFIGCHVAQTGSVGATGISYMVRAQPGLVQFPQNIEVIGGSQAGGCSFDNSLAVWNAGPYPGIIFDTYKTADGAPVPPLTANGGTRAPSYMFRGVTDNGVKFGWSPEVAAQVLAASSTIAPDTEIVQLTTNVAVDIANITPPRQAFSVANGTYRITLIPTYTESGSVFIRLVTGGNIASRVQLKNLVAVTLVYSEGTGLWSLETGGTSSGTYTPTATGSVNIDAITPLQAQWLCVGNVVTVSGCANVDTTAGTTGAPVNSQFFLSLPIGTNITSVTHLSGAGVGNASGTSREPVSIYGEAANDRAEFNFASESTVSRIMTYHFTYVLQN